jgi:hypothetical protein
LGVDLLQEGVGAGVLRIHHMSLPHARPGAAPP